MRKTKSHRICPFKTKGGVLHSWQALEGINLLVCGTYTYISAPGSGSCMPASSNTIANPFFTPLNFFPPPLFNNEQDHSMRLSKKIQKLNLLTATVFLV
jgi:hypothetical protein